jgi:CheY-like chemotaxis protein
MLAAFEPSRPRVLLVDDEAAILSAMDEYLTACDYTVDCADDGAQAMALLAREAYAVVIADLRLSAADDDGLAVLAWVREHRPATRTILLTAYGSPTVELEAHRRGVDVVLPKPQPLRAIVRIIDQLLRDA